MVFDIARRPAGVGRPVVAAVLVAVAFAAAIGLALYLRGRNLAPDFTLTDQTGRPFTLSAQRGKSVALFFGYTHCPDECPTTLAHLEAAVRSLGAAGAGVEPIFITVDPARDSPAALKKYLSSFGTNLVGLTGSKTALQQTYAEYHIFFQKLPEGPGGYDVAHSSALVYIDAAGRLRGYGDSSDDVGDIAARLRELAG
jgi:protein SCO1/2